MLRRTLRCLAVDNVTGEGVSFRALPSRAHLSVVLHSPYKESFKEYWATPIPWERREYGPKPKPGDPIPLRNAATMLVVGKNKHIDPQLVESGEDNDYKVLMMYREARGQYTKDQFLFPSRPICVPDMDSKWADLLQRLGVTTAHKDLPARITAIRALVAEAAILVVPPEGGRLANIEGPPGGLKRWHMIIHSHPEQLRNLIDILEIPYESALKSLLPLCRIQTPPTETFRFDNTAFVVTYPKVPEVKLGISTIGEKLIWVSPKEAVKRFNAGVMEMPTPNLIFLTELDQRYPKYEDVEREMKFDDVPNLIRPELVHNEETRMATVLVPGDVHHSETEALLAGGSEGAPERGYLKRFQYIKDEPWGVRAVYFDRPVTPADDLTPLTAVPPKTIEFGDDTMMALAAGERGSGVSGEVAEEIKVVAQKAARSKDTHPMSPRRPIPTLEFIDDQEMEQMQLKQKPTEIEKMAKNRKVAEPELNTLNSKNPPTDRKSVV